MPTDFDALRQAPLPDSFDRTADWLRHAPQKPGPARPLLLVAVLAAVVGACAVPVSSGAVVGWAVEGAAPDGHALVRVLDGAVLAEDRLSADVLEGEPHGLEAVVYVVLEAEASERARVAAEGAGFKVRVRPLDLEVRQPLGVAAARWLGVSGSPRVSDADLQLALDRAFAGHDLAPRVERTADGRRALVLNRAFRIDGLDPETRIARRGSTISIRGGDLSGVTIGGVPTDELSRLTPSDLRALDAEIRALEGDPFARLDSLGPPPPDLDAYMDSLEAGSTYTRGFLVRIDSTD